MALSKAEKQILRNIMTGGLANLDNEGVLKLLDTCDELERKLAVAVEALKAIERQQVGVGKHWTRAHAYKATVDMLKNYAGQALKQIGDTAE